MDYITLMVVTDERSPVRRLQIRTDYIKRAVAAAGVVVLLGMVGVWDYWRVRADNVELAELRVLAAEQSEQIESVEKTLTEASDELDRMREFERKVRIIANLPGSAGVGGEGVAELAPARPVGGEERVMPPAGVPVDLTQPAPAVPAEEPVSRIQLEFPEVDPVTATAEGLTTKSALRIYAMESYAGSLSDVLEGQADSLELLLGDLEEKRSRLASMPSVWPTKGWLTSRYGYRISPFTGKRHLHAGIDVASEPGTPIVAPARGKVEFVGNKGPLGETLILNHGYGVRTYYGHTKEIYVKKGDEVVRGQQVAAVGSTGRSTGPHLHYAVKIDGKSKDPLDYIFD